MYLILLFLLLLFSVTFFYLNTREGFTTDFQEILPITIEGDNKTISVPTNIKGNDVTNLISFQGDIRIKKENCIEFAQERGQEKEFNAGKIGYQRFSDALDIVGAGTGPRRTRLWDDVFVTQNLNVGQRIECRNFQVNDSLKANERIECKTLNITSDERVKHKKSSLDSKKSLEKVRELTPKRFHYKNGKQPVYGFIAQEVEKAVPSCVTKQKSYIANIYDTATIKENVLTFKHFNTNELAYKGKTLYSNLKLRDNQEEIIVTILRVLDKHTIEIDKPLTKDKVLVYGQEVDDFLTIDQNQLSTLTTSALQEVDNQQQIHEKTLENILKRLSTLETKEE